MEQFRKWAGPGFNWGSNPLDRSGLDQAQRGWRAALEEVLKVCEMYEENWDHSISDWIKQELGDTQWA